MPLFRPSGSGPAMGFKAPRTSGGGGSSDAAAGDDAASKRTSVGSAPTPARKSGLRSSGVNFKSPKSEDAPIPAGAGVAAGGGGRQVMYPEAKGRHVDAATADMIGGRLKKLDTISYHQPAAVVAKKAAQAAAAATVATNDDDDSAAASAPTALPGAADAKAAALAATADPAADGSDEDDTPEHIDSRFDASPLGKVYFQVSVDGATTRHDATGIIIVDVEVHAVQMFDRLGRQYGNRPDPGYPLKPEEVAALKAGSTLKVGLKPVKLITALAEEAFRSGEFFLRKEHDQRLKDEKRREKESAAAQLAKKAKMSLGSGFAGRTFRKRPAEGESGFIVPVMGRIKGDKDGKRGILDNELRPLFDPDRDTALNLFRADYKRDINGRRIVSVVVDPQVGDRLRPHQRIGVQFLFDCVTGVRMPGYYGAILADEMGLGKSVQTVATVWTCLRQGKYGIPVSRKAIVVAPSSLVRNWQMEFEKWLGEGAVKVMAIAESTAKGDRILSRFESEGEVLVISYDQLRKYVGRLATVKAVDLVVCDEGHRLKNAEIKTSKAVDSLPTRRRIVLSGTPIQNDLAEFHAMVSFVNPGILGNTDLFKRVFEDPVMVGRDPKSLDEEKELGRDRAHYLANLTSRFILRRTQTINEKYLPAKVELTVFVRLGDEQRATYQRISGISSEYQSAPLVLITALKKLCNHMDLLVDAMSTEGSHVKLPKTVLPKGYRRGNLGFTYGAKLNFVSLMLDELVSNGDKDKLVIVSNYTQTLSIIAALCDSKNVFYFQLDGSTPIKKRQDLVDRFNVPTQREIVFLLSSKAGGVGLNLIGANRLILFDPDWNPANDAQAMGRVWRDGQKKKVFIYRLLSTGTIEEKVYQRQVSKQGLSANVVDMQDDSKQHFTSDDLRALFNFNAKTVCDTHDLLGCKCQVPADPGAARPSTSGDVTKMKFKKVGDPSEVKEKAGGPRMDELKSWQHVANARTFQLDKVMQTMAKHNPDLVSFLFANERDAEKLKGPAVQPERPFVADEGEITCASQDGRGGRNDPEIEVLGDDEDSDWDDDEDSD